MSKPTILRYHTAEIRAIERRLSLNEHLTRQAQETLSHINVYYTYVHKNPEDDTDADQLFTPYREKARADLIRLENERKTLELKLLDARKRAGTYVEEYVED